MARVRFKSVMDGPSPSERIISISLKGGGEEEIILSKDLVSGDTLEVGKVGATADKVLIELPQESASGSRRLWVDPKTLVA